MAKKKANGEGTIFKRQDGRYTARFYYEDPQTGRREKWEAITRRRADARIAMDTARKRVEEGAPVRDDKASVAKWMHEWCAEGGLVEVGRKATTCSGYRALSRTHLEPDPFGAITLDRLRPTHIDKLVLELKDAGLADSTVRTIYSVLRGALTDAVRHGLIARNAAVDVKRPSVEAKEMRCLDLDELASLLRAAETSRYHDLLALLASTGLRRGEALALTWDDVDLEAGLLHVRGTLSRIGGRLVVTSPKSKAGKRDVPLSPAMVWRLRLLAKRQGEECQAAANLWVETGHVFTTEFGTPVDPRNAFRTIQAAAKAAGLENVGLHTLRHSAATAWSDDGVPPKELATRLGHVSITTTEGYMHANLERSRKAIDRLSDAIGL